MKIIQSISTKQDGYMISDVSLSKNSTFSQARCAIALRVFVAATVKP